MRAFVRENGSSGRSIPVRRPGTVEEIARLVLFPLSDDCPYVTGAEIAVAGGAAPQRLRGSQGDVEGGIRPTCLRSTRTPRA